MLFEFDVVVLFADVPLLLHAFAALLPLLLFALLRVARLLALADMRLFRSSRRRDFNGET